MDSPEKQEKMKGVVAQIRDSRGISRTVFRPYCDVFLGKLGDYLGEIVYDDPGSFLEQFGVEVAERVWQKDEVVEVEVPLKADEEIRRCPHKNPTFTKQSYSTRRGDRYEDLVHLAED